MEELKLNFKDKFEKRLLILTIIGFLLRILWIINIESVPVSDFAAYHNLAVSVFDNETAPFLGFQGPGYPLALGLFYKLIGSTSIFGAKIFNLIFSTLAMIIMLKVFKIIFNNKNYVYISYAIVIFLPNYVAYNNILATECFLLFIFSLIILQQVSDKQTILSYVFLGIFIGLSALIKPYMIIYPVIAALAFYLKHKELKRTFKLFLIVQLTCLCVIAPWTYRNYKVYNDFVTISYNDGYVMYINNNDQNKSGWMSIRDVKMTEETLKKISNAGYSYEQAVSYFDTKLNKIFKQEAIKWIKKNPVRFIGLSLKRVYATFFSGAGDVAEWSMNGNNNGILYFLVSNPLFKFISDMIIQILSLTGLVFVIKNAISILKAIFDKISSMEYKVSIPIMNIAFNVMLSVVYEGQPRYNFTTLFMFVICLCILIDNFKQFQYSKSSVKGI